MLSHDSRITCMFYLKALNDLPNYWMLMSHKMTQLVVPPLNNIAGPWFIVHRRMMYIPQGRRKSWRYSTKLQQKLLSWYCLTLPQRSANIDRVKIGNLRFSSGRRYCTKICQPIQELDELVEKQARRAYQQNVQVQHLHHYTARSNPALVTCEMLTGTGEKAAVDDNSISRNHSNCINCS